MKRKVAVIANGWNSDYLQCVIEGMRKCASENNIDLFIFISYTSSTDTDEENEGELNEYAIRYMDLFDGIIILSNDFTREESSHFFTKLKDSNVPFISFEGSIEGFDSISTDNYTGLYELTEHMIKEHNVKNIVYIGGPAGNDEDTIRHQAISDALKNNGLELKPENSLHANWSYSLSRNAMAKWLSEHGSVPDAIMCANDFMAFGVCNLLTEKGIKVPDEVRITGYDHLFAGQTFYPAISSVDRGWDKLGYEGFQLLLSRMNGRTKVEQHMLASRMAIEESCGCRLSSEQLDIRLKACSNIYQEKVDMLVFDWHIRDMDKALSNSSNIAGLQEACRNYFAEYHSFEGDGFSIYMNSSFNDRNLHGQEFKAEDPLVNDMDTFIDSADPGSGRKPLAFDQIINNYDPYSDKADLFVIIPLHMHEKSLGYAVLKDEVKLIYNKWLYTLKKHFDRDLERLIQNMMIKEMNRKLRELSVTDPLTHLYNREGYTELAVPYLEKCRAEGKTGIIMFADINHMKIINDKYGHEQGDAVLKSAAFAIRKCIPDEWIAVRYGGDEFIAAGSCADIAEAGNIKSAIADTLKGISDKMSLCIPISMSIGETLISPADRAVPINDYVSIADHNMYAIKEKMHDSEDPL